MKSLVAGIIHKDKIVELDTRKIPALQIENDSENGVEIKTLWGRTVFKIEKKDDGFLISPDLCGGLPVFAYSHEDKLYFANNLADLVGLIPKDQLPDIDWNNAVRYVLMQYSGLGETIFKNLKVFNGLNQLYWNNQEMNLEIYNYPDIQVNSDTSFSDLLSKSLEWAKSINSNELGVTLSGGIDSSVVWASLNKMGVKPTPLTIVWPGDMGLRQHGKISELLQNDFSNWIKVNNDGFSFGEDPLAMYQDMYYQLGSKLGELAKSKGIKVVLTGTGGNELAAASREKEGGFKEVDIRLPSYFTPKILKMWESIAANEKDVVRQIPVSATYSSGQIFGLNYEQDIWVENIFCYPEYWFWIKNTAKEWGENKQGFRDYLAENGYSNVAGSQEKENFKEIFETANKTFVMSDKYDSLFDNSELAKMDLIDLDVIKDIKNSFDDASENAKGNLYFAYSLENMLQYYIALKART